MGIIQTLTRALKLVENLQNSTTDSSKINTINIHVDETGTSGTENYGGYYYEEYLSTLRGTQAADLWDQMRRSDPKVKMVLSAVKNPIKSAHWTIQPSNSSDSAKRHAELVEQILFKDLELSWMQQISEILTMLEFGFSMFEVIHKVVMNHPKFGSYNSLAKLAWRSPRTIERWNLDKEGKLCSVSQYAYGDLGKIVDIPGVYLLIFTNEKEGDNYEGVSALRPCYGPWVRKNTYLKLMAVGLEKFAVPTPYMEVPEGKENSIQYANAKKVLEKYVSHQQQYLTIPAGWKLQFAQSNFDASKIREAIDKENAEMAFAFLENFLELGQSGSGSYALSNDLSDFFLTGIEHLATNICETFNKYLIPDLVKLNFGPQLEYPELQCTGIKDKPGKELAEIMKLLVEAKILTPDVDLEKNFREKYGLPVQTGERVVAAPAAPAVIPKLSEKMPGVFHLVDSPKTPRSLISTKADELKSLMVSLLGDIGKQVIADLISKKKNSTPSQYLSITNKVSPVGTRNYKTELQDFLTSVASDTFKQIRKEIPGGNKVKLRERIDSLKLAELKFSDLPVSIQKQIESQIGLLTNFQIQDLLKALFFQFNSSVGSTDSDSTLEADLQDTLSKYLESPSVVAGAGNSVASTVNESRSSFFFDPEVYDQIESFTFTNGDPVSPICQDLAGTVFAKDDPNMERYSPPLHHNCKSYLVANLTGTTKKIDPEGLVPSDPSLEKYITLTENQPGAFVLASIDISKETAFSQADAKKLALEVTNIDPSVGIQESDLAYRIELIDPGMIEQGSLKSFEPMEGVQVYYGRIKRMA